MATQRGVPDTEVTGWVGWVYFAGFIMVISGSLNTIYGFVAAVNNDWVVFSNRDALLLNVSGWGWLHVIIGLVVLIAGFGLFSGNALARAVGVVGACFSLVANFLWLPLYPIWSLVIMTIDVLVLWALIVHGGEARYD